VDAPPSGVPNPPPKNVIECIEKAPPVLPTERAFAEVAEELIQRVKLADISLDHWSCHTKTQGKHWDQSS
jgi:hypothetical protein